MSTSTKLLDEDGFKFRGYGPAGAAICLEQAPKLTWVVSNSALSGTATWVVLIVSNKCAPAPYSWGKCVNSAIFVTGNANKLKEVRYILASGGTQIEVEGRDLDVPEIQGTTQEVAREKCRKAAEIVGGPCITEDTALCFDALGGLPGPYIKHFMKTLGHDGLNKLLIGFPSTSASALCTFAYCAGPGSEPILFEGRTQGRIVPPRGDGNFGWDPIFEAEDTGKTYAEMTIEEKNGLSHRYKALDSLRNYLQKEGN